MAYRFSKEELDERFEEFLKESLSDDSLGNANKKSSVLETLGQPRKKETRKKDSVPWWMSEEDLDDGDFETRFVKLRKEKKMMGSDAAAVENSEQKSPHSDSQSGMLGANGSFVKIQNTSQPAGESSEYMHTEKMQLQKSDGAAVSLTRDSLETNGSYSEDFEEETDANPAFKTEASQVKQDAAPIRTCL